MLKYPPVSTAHSCHRCIKAQRLYFYLLLLLDHVSAEDVVLVPIGVHHQLQVVVLLKVGDIITVRLKYKECLKPTFKMFSRAEFCSGTIVSAPSREAEMKPVKIIIFIDATAAQEFTP